MYALFMCLHVCMYNFRCCFNVYVSQSVETTEIRLNEVGGVLVVTFLQLANCTTEAENNEIFLQYIWFRLSPGSQWTGTRVKWPENLVSTTSVSSCFIASTPIRFSKLLLRLWNSCNFRDAPSSLWYDFHSDAGISFKQSNLTVS